MRGPRSTSRHATPALLLMMLLGVVAAPGHAAERLSASSTGYAGGPVLAAGGRVVIADRLAPGRWQILAIDPRTRAVTKLTRFAALPDARTFSVLRLQGSGGIVTATLDTFADVSGSTAEQAQPPLQTSRAYTLLPASASLGMCDVRADFPAPILAAGGADFVATAGDDCDDTSALHIRSPTGILTIPATPGGTSPTQIFDLRAAGSYAAWRESRVDGDGPKSSLVAARAATGEVLLRVPAVSRFGLGSDGMIALADAAGCSLRTVSLAPLAARSAALGAGLCPGLLGDVAVAAGRVVYPTAGSYAVSDVQGAAHAVAGLLVESAGRAQVAFDGRTLYGVRRGCHEDLLLAADTTVPGGAPLPLAPPPSLTTCPVRRAGPGRVRVARDRRVSIRLRCPAGCRGTVRLVEQRSRRRERIVGSADFSSRARTFTVRPRIAGYARALAGCGRGLRMVAQLHRPGDGAKGLGAYRILSRRGCRRSGGPSFGAPRPWPQEGP